LNFISKAIHEQHEIHELTRKSLALPQKSNTTNGSWWIVQIQPTHNGQHKNREIPPTAVGGLFRSCLFNGSFRLDLKYPPTAVGGITEESKLDV
jgi:hypothetical protein